MADRWIHLAILSDDKSGGQAVTNCRQRRLRKRSVFEWPYLYLLALYKKDNETIQFVTDTIARYYKNAFD